MAEYWNARYAQTLAELGRAPSPVLRAAYLDLADHYRLMRQLCERSPQREARRIAC